MSITINYKEAAVLTGMPQKDCKELYAKILDKDKITDDMELDLFRLDIEVPNIRSNNKELDGKGMFTTAAIMAKSNYRKYLSHKTFLTQGVMPPGATVFYKICTPEQLEHIESRKPVSK